MHEKVQKTIDKLLNAFETGDVPEALATVVLPRKDVPCAKWSLSNRILAFLSDTSDARGFRQWEQVGRYPKKGSKAFHILGPKKRKIQDKETEEEKMILTGFVAVPVFRFEDTDGENLDLPNFTPPEMPPLFEVAEQWNLSISWQSFQGHSYGYYAPGKGEIVLATHAERTFFHELAHAAHHKVLGQLNIRQDWKQEVVAELTAAVLCHLYGKRPDDGNCYRYIRRYAEEEEIEPHKACLSVIADVERCLNLIIQTKEEKEKEVLVAA